MPNPLPRVPGYCLHKPRNLAYVRLGGETIYLGPWNSPESRANYERVIAEYLASGRLPPSQKTQPRLSVNQMLVAFLHHAQSYYREQDGSPSRELANLTLPIQLLKQLYGETSAADFGPLSLKAVRQKMIEKNLCRNVINQRTNSIRRIFKWAVSEEHVPSSVYEALRTVEGLKNGRSPARETAPVGPVAAPATPVAATTNISDTLRPANREAMALTGRSYVSHSQLWLMRSCPRKFAFTYIENAPRDFAPTSLVFGGAIHAALEQYFRGLLEGFPLDGPTLIAVFRAAWDAQQQGDIPIRYNASEDKASLDALAQRMIAAFLASPLAAPQGEVLGVEEQLQVTLHDDLPDVLARVDLVTMTDGAIHIIDFKTSRSRWTDAKAVESGDQLVLYGLSAGTMSQQLALPIHLHFAVLTKAKAPVVQLLPVPGDPGRIAVATETALQTWTAVRAGNFYPSPSPQNCTTCPFRSRCPVFSGSSTQPR